MLGRQDTPSSGRALLCFVRGMLAAGQEGSIYEVLEILRRRSGHASPNTSSANSLKHRPGAVCQGAHKETGRIVRVRYSRKE